MTNEIFELFICQVDGIRGSTIDKTHHFSIKPSNEKSFGIATYPFFYVFFRRCL